MSWALPAEGRSQADASQPALRVEGLYCLISFQRRLARVDIEQEIHGVMFGVLEDRCLATPGDAHRCQNLCCWFTVARRSTF